MHGNYRRTQSQLCCESVHHRKTLITEGRKSTGPPANCRPGAWRHFIEALGVANQRRQASRRLSNRSITGSACCRGYAPPDSDAVLICKFAEMSSEFDESCFVEFDRGTELEHASVVHDVLRRPRPSARRAPLSATALRISVPGDNWNAGQRAVL